MQDPYLASVREAIAQDALEPDGPRLISVDELRAAGALDVPPAWRKSLIAGCERAEKNDASEFPLFADLISKETSEEPPSAEEAEG